MEAGGFERTPLALSETAISQTPSAKSGALEGEKTPKDPDLALVQERWPKLPEHIKAAVLALVRSTADKEPSL